MSEPQTHDWEDRVRLPTTMSGPGTPGWNERIRLAIDYGTGYLKLAVQYIYPGRRETADDICNVCLDDHNDNKDVEIQQTGVWVYGDGTDYKRGRLIWGRANVEAWLAKHPNQEKEVFSNWKLALMKVFRKREAVQHTIKALGCEDDDESIIASLKDVITDHLRQIKEGVLKCCIEEHEANYRRHRPDWVNLPWETQISIPASWDWQANGVMASAAFDAGFEHTNLREEPLCVAGSVISRLFKIGVISAHDLVLFLDVGGGTTDATLARFRLASEDASQMILERVGPSKGNQGGSFMVNDEAWIAFKIHPEVLAYGGIAALCKMLSITQEECQRQVSRNVERVKQTFDPNSSSRSPRGMTSSLSRRDHTEITLQCLRAVFTGGGVNSRYLRHRLTETLKLRDDRFHVSDAGVKYACAHGALLHYLFEADKPQPNASFFVTQTEIYDEHLHPEYNSTSDPVHGRLEAEKYEWDNNDRVVRDRLMPIMQIVNHRQTPSLPVPMHFHLQWGAKWRLHFNIYGTVHPHLHKEHDPLKDEDGKVFTDLMQYPIAFVDVPSLHSRPYNFRPVWAQRRKGHYEVLGLVDMQKVGDSYELVVKLLKKSHQWKRDANGILLPRQTHEADDVIWTAKRRIWDPFCSAFVRSNVAQPEPVEPQAARTNDGESSSNPINLLSSSDADPEERDALPPPREKRMGKRSRDQPGGLPMNSPRKR